MTIKPIFAWYDLWIGAFWDRKERKLYILPVPCIGIVIEFRHSNPEEQATLNEEIWSKYYEGLL